MKGEPDAHDADAQELVAYSIRLLEWGAGRCGGLPNLAAAAQVGEDDLERWIAGRPPMERRSKLLHQVDTALLKKFSDYPPEGYPGGLLEIAKMYQGRVKREGATGEQPDGRSVDLVGALRERQRTRRRLLAAVGLAAVLVAVVALALRSSDGGSSPVATAGRDTSLPQRSPTRSVVVPTGNATVPGSVQRPYADPNGPGTAKVTWGRPDSDGGKPIIQYRVQAYDLTAKKLLGFQYTTGTAKTFADLTDGHVYIFKIEAINDVGLGPVSDTNTISPPAARL